jgi:HAD superfamily hydrolase (TIGR01509 family)
MASTTITLRAIILDFDGLILETEGACFAAWQVLFAEHGHPYAKDEYLKILGSGDRPSTLFEQRCGPPPDWAPLNVRLRAIEARLNEGLAPMPGVVDLLAQARALGLRIGIASSSSHAWVDGHLRAHGLFDGFDAIVCRDDVPRVKPEPDLYLEAVRRLAVEPRETVAFEDSHTGSTAAKSAGLWCVAVPTEMTAGQGFSHADLRVPTLDGFDLTTLAERLADRLNQSGK